MIPNIVHFIFGVTDNPAGREFTFLSYLAVATAWAVHKPERILLHYQYEPVGPW